MIHEMVLFLLTFWCGVKVAQFRTLSILYNYLFCYLYPMEHVVCKCVVFFLSSCPLKKQLNIKKKTLHRLRELN